MKEIVCDGFWDDDMNGYDVNMSSIWSHLIRECGRYTDDYNSDLLYDIDFIKKQIVKEINEINTFWIGFRESGVDGYDFIKSRCKSEYYYRAIYKIVLEKTDRKCKVSLIKSSAYDFRKENKISFDN